MNLFRIFNIFLFFPLHYIFSSKCFFSNNRFNINLLTLNLFIYFFRLLFAI